MVERLNCVGYVYHTLGLIEKEKYIHPPYLEEILKDFEIVENFRQADAVAVAIFDGTRDPYVIHMAKIEKDGWRTKLTHRYGVGHPITNEGIRQGLKSFLKYKNTETVFLTLKNEVV